VAVVATDGQRIGFVGPSGWIDVVDEPLGPVVERRLPVRVPAPAQPTAEAVTAVAAGKRSILEVTATGKVFRSDDLGASWVLVRDSDPGSSRCLWPSAIAIDRSGRGLFATYPGRLFTTRDDGQTWTRSTSTEELPDDAGVDGSARLAAVLHRLLPKSGSATNGGAANTPPPIPGTLDVYPVRELVALQDFTIRLVAKSENEARDAGLGRWARTELPDARLMLRRRGGGPEHISALPVGTYVPGSLTASGSDVYVIMRSAGLVRLYGATRRGGELSAWTSYEDLPEPGPSWKPDHSKLLAGAGKFLAYLPCAGERFECALWTRLPGATRFAKVALPSGFAQPFSMALGAERFELWLSDEFGQIARGSFKADARSARNGVFQMDVVADVGKHDNIQVDASGGLLVVYEHRTRLRQFKEGKVGPEIYPPPGSIARLWGTHGIAVAHDSGGGAYETADGGVTWWAEAAPGGQPYSCDQLGCVFGGGDRMGWNTRAMPGSHLFSFSSMTHAWDAAPELIQPARSIEPPELIEPVSELIQPIRCTAGHDAHASTHPPVWVEDESGAWLTWTATSVKRGGHVELLAGDASGTVKRTQLFGGRSGPRVQQYVFQHGAAVTRVTFQEPLTQSWDKERLDELPLSANAGDPANVSDAPAPFTAEVVWWSPKGSSRFVRSGEAGSRFTASAGGSGLFFWWGDKVEFSDRSGVVRHLPLHYGSHLALLENEPFGARWLEPRYKPAPAVDSPALALIRLGGGVPPDPVIVDAASPEPVPCTTTRVGFFLEFDHHSREQVFVDFDALPHRFRGLKSIVRVHADGSTCLAGYAAPGLKVFTTATGAGMRGVYFESLSSRDASGNDVTTYRSRAVDCGRRSAR
jgi:hypothetical protein